MSKEFVSIKPSGGVSRIKNGDINRPYNLENAQMELRGFVRSVNKPTVQFNTETSDTKPYTEWNGAVLDRESFSAIGGEQIAAEAFSDATLNARLYRSVKGFDTEDNDNYRTVKFYSDWDFDAGSEENFQGESALIHTAAAVNVAWTSFNFVTAAVASTDVEPVAHVGYLVIPFDKNDEAGPWYHFTVEREVELVSAGAPQMDLFKFVDVLLTGSDALERVEIYRTLDMNQRGFVHRGPIPLTELTSGDGALLYAFDIDHTYYFFGEYRASLSTPDGNKQILFRDDNVWVNAPIFEIIKNETTYIIEEPDSLVWGFPFATLDAAFNRIKAPTETLQRGRNLLSTHDDPTGEFEYQFHGVTAEVMSAHSDVIMYGNVRIPTKRPSTGLVMHDQDSSYGDIEAQLEYLDNRGHVYYGPKETFTDTQYIKFAWQGENALLIFVGGDLFERLSPNEFGMYVTGYTRQGADDEAFLPPVSFVVDAETSGVTFTEDPDAELVDYYTEPGAVFLSASQRGMEVTYDSFFVKADETVRAIEPARLAEDESLRDYDFYVFTDKSVTLYKRTGDDLRTVIPVHNVTNRLGVQQVSFTALVGTDPTIINLATPTRFGVAFIGTDDRVYHLVGRDLQQLDLEIPGLFVDAGGFRDIEYHANCDQLWLLFNFATIWVYDFIQRGWTINHILSDVHYNIYYREDTGIIHSWGDILGIDKTFLFDDDPDNIHEQSVYITQPIDDGGQDTQVVEMQVGYTVTDYTELSRSNWATIRHAIDSPKIARAEEVYDPSNGRRKVEYQIPANRSFYPTLVGRGHQFKISSFQELRDIELKMLKAAS